MAGLDGIKAIWNDPKKRPFVLAGAGVATGAGILAMRRPTDPDEAALEDQAAAEAGAGSDPLGVDVAGGGEYQYGGTLPPVYALGGAGNDAFAEQDLSGIYGELDMLEAGFQANLDDALASERSKNASARRGQSRRLKKAEQRLASQRKKNRKQDAQLARLKKRRRSKGRGKGKGKGSRRPANRPTARDRRAARRRPALKSRH